MLHATPLQDIESVLHSGVIDEIAICLAPGDVALIEPLTRLCEEEGKIVRIPLETTGLTLPGARSEEFDGITVLSLVYGPDRAIALLGKRLLDIVLAIIGLIVLTPVFALVTLIMVTTESERSKVVGALNEGADGYVVKPFTKESIVQKLSVLGVDAF